ncbi:MULTISPECIES: diacylglycerol kinase [unclassified Streptomyces]|uniref:diacylglycerol kinase n=1 Tax=unclassified Streptomyces TaxID=2593676 RepID=UPI0033D1338D
MSAADRLLVVIDPVARRIDGESVRIAKDVLCAAAQAKICWPEGVEEFSRALARRGGRRLVVVGDDHALLRTVTLLQREHGLSGPALSVVPVGSASAVEITRSLGVPTDAVAAARAVLEGVPRRRGLLVDDGGGVVLGELRIPAPAPAPVRAAGPTVWGTCRSLVRTLVGAPTPVAAAVAHHLRIETDGTLLTDLDRPLAGVSVGCGDGVAQVVVEECGGSVVRGRGSVVEVSVGGVSVGGMYGGGAAGGRGGGAGGVSGGGVRGGEGFRYRAGQVVVGPVWSRTWTAGSWALMVPAGGEATGG